MKFGMAIRSGIVSLVHFMVSACGFPRRALLRPMLMAAVLAVSAAHADSSAELYAASAAGQLERVDALLAQGADANAKNTAERTPLMAAAAAGNVRIVRKLLAFGADPNLADKRGVTPLMEAAAHGYEEVVKQLVAAGSDVEAKDSAGQSVAEKARRNGQGRIVALLEKSGLKAVEAPTPDGGPAKEGENRPDEAKKDGAAKAESGR
ncbi:MAG: ankyrin repeat domain-containing protein [Methylococcaceae bacterium]|nr:ankyrin repeat domain-containing protein [Methylococcaceae bacterium]